MDYDTGTYDPLMDADSRSFLERFYANYPSNLTDLSLEERRQIYTRICRAFRTPPPDAVETEDLVAEGVPVRVYSAGTPTRTVYYTHGGGFAIGGLDSHDDICADICAQTGYRVVAVDYRLAPVHKHPAAFDDCWKVLQWILDKYPDPVVLSGDSAGGNLAAGLTQHARGRLPGVIGQVLIYPQLSSDLETGSQLQHTHAPILSRDAILAFRVARLAGREPTDDPTYAPLQDDDFAGLPPTVLFSADLDPLKDDCAIYRDRLAAAGVPVHWVNEPKLFHGYLHARSNVKRASESFERISVAIEALGQEIWPYD